MRWQEKTPLVVANLGLKKKEGFEMASFGDDQLENPAPGAKKRNRVGMAFISIFALGLIVSSLVPSPYVIEEPGPAVDVLSQANGIDVISIDGADTYPTTGQLDLLSVRIRGNREKTPQWLDILSAWLDPRKAVVPLDQQFPPSQTTQQNAAESTAMMEQSQQSAIAAALIELGYKVPKHVYVAQVMKGGPSSQLLKATDYILSADGKSIKTPDDLRAIVGSWSKSEPISLRVLRGGKQLDISVKPKTIDGEIRLGVVVGVKYDFPVTVTVKLDEIGGPSGGLMFALGITDLLTPGYLNGGKHIAGTGTISEDGAVGAIGGIRQKLYSAVENGATWFLAPAANCSEVIGRIPAGLSVAKVSTLDEALDALAKIRSGQTKDIPTCTTN